MNVYDYRTIPPEESSYHARAQKNSASYGNRSSGEKALEESNTAQAQKPADGQAAPGAENRRKAPDSPPDRPTASSGRTQNIIPDQIPRRDGPGGN